MLAAFEAACCAANGVPLRDPRKPSEPELFQESTFPFGSVMVTIVLLNEAWMCTTPNETCLRSFFLKVFFLPFFSGAAAPVAAAGFAMKNPSLAVGYWLLAKPLSLGILPTTNGQQRFLRLCRRFLLLRDCSLAWS